MATYMHFDEPSRLQMSIVLTLEAWLLWSSGLINRLSDSTVKKSPGMAVESLVVHRKFDRFRISVDAVSAVSWNASSCQVRKVFSQDQHTQS